MKMKPWIVLAFSAFALTVAGGCNSAGTTIVGPTPGPTCGPNVSSQLVYPAPGATAVPDTTSEIVIAVSSPLPINTYNVALIALNNGGGSGQTANYLSQISASQLPPGSAPTTITNPTYEAVNLITTLPAATQLQVAINNPASTCTPQNVPGGVFTTQ